MNENPANKKQDRVSRTKSRISDAYISLIPEKNWEKITVKEVCERAGVSRGTFYQYFDDIYDVMEQVQSGLISELSERLQKSKPVTAGRADPNDDFERYFDMNTPPLFVIWYSFCEEHKTEFLSLCHLDNGDLCFPNRIRTLIRPHLDAMMDRDGLPRDSYREHFHVYFFKLMYYVMYGWLKKETNIGMTSEMMADVINVTRIGASYSYYKKRLSEELLTEHNGARDNTIP